MESALQQHAADDLWTEVLGILRNDTKVSKDGSQCGWSLDKVNGILIFLGCVKGYEQSVYAPMLIKWVQQKQAAQINSVSRPVIADSSQSAVVYAAYYMFSSVSREQLRSEGLLTRKDLKQLYRKGSSQETV